MSANIYHLSKRLEDDTLRVVAASAKVMLLEIDSIANIYKTNNELLYGNSPKQLFFLMQQNNKPLYSPSPSSIKNSDADVSYPGPSTPISRNSDVAIGRRIQLSNSPLDDAQRTGSNTETVDTNTPVRHRLVKKDAAILSPTVNETAVVDEQFTSPVGSTGSPEVANQDSPCSAKIITLAESFKMEDKEVGSPSKVANNNEADNKESPRSAELTRITGSLTVEEKDTSLVLTRADGEINASNQGFPRSSGVIRHTSDLVLDTKDSKCFVVEEQIDANTYSLNSGTKSKSHGTDSINKHSINTVEETFKIPYPVKVKKESRSPVKKVLYGEDQMAANTDSCRSGEKSGKSDIADLSDKDSVNLAKGMVKITNPTERRDETPSPVKRLKMCRISDAYIHEFSSPTEKVQSTDSSIEDGNISFGSVQVDKMNVSPNEESKGIVVDKRKRKSSSPKRRNATIFRSMPRVTQSTREGEIDIELPCDSEDNHSPTTSRISSAVISPLTKSPIMSEPKTDDSPKTDKQFLSPSEKANNFSRNVSIASSLGSDDDNVFTDNNPSDTSSIIETSTGDQSSKSESSVTNNETENLEFKHTAMKFQTLYSLRHQVLHKIATSLLYIRNNVEFLDMYAENAGFAVSLLSSSNKWYASEELKETANEATAIASKLRTKLNPWVKDMDREIDTWGKYFRQIEQLKTKYGPFISNDGKPLMTIETLQLYEHELKSIWKRMDEMIVMGDTRRHLFTQTAYDLEKLIKIFVKSLVMVGILQTR